MQEVFEKIIQRLRTEKNMDRSFVYSTEQCDAIRYAFGAAIDAVKVCVEEYNNGWIPVSKRLPEKYGDYLVAWKPLHMSAEDIIKKVGREVPHFYEIVEYDPDDEALWIGSIEQAHGEYEIIAWQPLPLPYTKGE